MASSVLPSSFATVKAYAKMLDLQAAVWLSPASAFRGPADRPPHVQQLIPWKGVDDPRSQRIMRTLLPGACSPARSLKISLIKQFVWVLASMSRRHQSISVAYCSIEEYFEF